ncbi:MAG TPA: methyltransferase domain-containing protein [Bryobacteraceae bacterium]|nr:methyltransferase domain-containing protein [Bryobacteraceae bacterium]
MPFRWQDGFFKDIAVEMWKRAIPPQQTTLEVEYLEKTLRPPKEGCLLDICCGHGRHAVPLAGRGYRVTGADSSEDALEEARKAGAGSITWELRDMVDLPWTAEFDGAYCFGNSFGYLDRDSAQRFLGAVSRALKPGARFAMDTGMTAESILSLGPGQRWFRTGDILTLSERRFDVAAGRMDVDYTFLRGAEADTRPTSSYYFTVSELIWMHLQAGLKLVEAIGSVQGEPYSLGSRGLILVTERAV